MTVIKRDDIVCGRRAIEWHSTAETSSPAQRDELEEMQALAALSGDRDKAMLLLFQMARNGIASDEALEKRVMEAIPKSELHGEDEDDEWLDHDGMAPLENLVLGEIDRAEGDVIAAFCRSVRRTRGLEKEMRRILKIDA